MILMIKYKLKTIILIKHLLALKTICTLKCCISLRKYILPTSKMFNLKVFYKVQWRNKIVYNNYFFTNIMRY